MDTITGTYATPTTRAVSTGFTRMLVFSLLAHAIFSTAFFLTQHGRRGEGPVQYIDLNMAQAPSTVAPKVTTAVPAPPQPMVEPDEVVNAEKTAAPVEPASAEPQPQAAQEIPKFEKGTLGFGIVNGHFGSISDGRTLRDDMREYYLGMLAKFNETWWNNRAEVSAGRGAAFLVIVSRDGTIVGTNLLESSGNSNYDRVMLQALKSAGPLGPLPNSYVGDFFSAPLKFVAPLNLMNPFSG